MARITILGAGIIGLATATLLSRNHQVTVVARDLPGDDPSIEWASPWAEALIVLGGVSSSRDRKMQLRSFSELWKLSFQYPGPESGIRRIVLEDIFDDDRTESDIWWQKFMPEFQFLSSDKLPTGATIGVTYKTVVVNPNVFLPWLKEKLENSGVSFKTMNVKSLSDIQHMGHDILINATGVGSASLLDVQDKDIQMIRGQTIVIKHNYDKAMQRDDGVNYTYAIPRMDGTVILGGVSISDAKFDWDVSQDIVNRVHNNIPGVFSNNLNDYEILGHNVGVRPARSSGIRLEREEKDGQEIVHAYGFGAGGYIHSFGAAHAVLEIVEDILLPPRPSKM
ncbi:hypothetical protein N7509_003310 [Penicillium cosmopolitanum]|uniref:FAD dependent oxidoreductase domain-containing protein n=1 Tax=Penicillium cosmopolitanum TaxID=1131564 RepID=A0A9X0BBD3_9EURO|nr:uncharacterized protein N7509_003310 [Penicillium cosmopolitanum]KAJ5403439.1 hypothetical protein N7509_003310 [Penicillium cosmopolitanum]